MANPTAIFLSGRLMVGCMDWSDAADLVRDTVEVTIVAVKHTYDLKRQIEGGEKLVTREFAALPPNAFLVNVVRREVVDTDELVGVFCGNRIDGAALDVTELKPLPSKRVLWSFDNVLVTSHNAGHAPKYGNCLTDIAAEHIANLREHGGN